MKRLPSLLLLLMTFVVLSSTFAMAANDEIFPITITDNSSTDRTNFPVLLSFNGTSLVNAGFVAANATDTNMQLGSTNTPFLMGTTQVPIFVASLPADEQITYKLLTGYSPLQSSFDVIVGSGGHVTISDHADLELGDNFTIETDVFFNSINGTYLHKPSAFSINFTDAGTVNVTVAGDASVVATGVTEALHTILIESVSGEPISPSSFTDSSGEWEDETLIYDEDTGTAGTDTTLNPNGWGEYIELAPAANITSCIGFRWVARWEDSTVIDAGISQIDLDAYYDSAWQNVYEGAYANRTWVEELLSETEDVSSVRIRFYNFTDSEVQALPQLYEFDFLSESFRLALSIDGVEQDSANLTANVTNNAQDWVFMDDDTAPYSDNLSITVDETQVLLFEPNEMITTTTLPDRAGTAQNGTITWGTNSNIQFSYGEVDEDADVALTPDATTIGYDAPALEMPDEWYATTSKIGNLPFYTTLNQVSTDTGIPLHTIYIGILVSIALAFGVFFAVAFKSAIPAVIIIGGILIMGADATIIPVWAIFTFLVAAAGILYAARAAN